MQRSVAKFQPSANTREGATSHLLSHVSFVEEMQKISQRTVHGNLCTLRVSRRTDCFSMIGISISNSSHFELVDIIFHGALVSGLMPVAIQYGVSQSAIRIDFVIPNDGANRPAHPGNIAPSRRERCDPYLRARSRVVACQLSQLEGVDLLSASIMIAITSC
ncbi:hypothetical protein SCHPADRAFT_896827 [Schizopora paradoxa]|uniref:Uncharacterized protein n=1 Tax=Schizopora paradoxa TaxID=27342 RepID=A0A0H2R5E9_9AGAM|nr:hypothetical protein SCHPADRAFT_896827 [Schizopora paradoxa]